MRIVISPGNFRVRSRIFDQIGYDPALLPRRTAAEEIDTPIDKKSVRLFR